MTRHEEIRTELRTLYTASAAATTDELVKEIEAKISYLETEAATIMLDAGR